MNEKKHTYPGTVKWVRLGKIVVSTHAQREKINKAKVDDLLANFELDYFGLPTVSERRGLYHILDGQHRIEALKRWLGDGWEDDQIECRVYENLTEQEEAEIFLRLNDAKPVTAYDKFRVGIHAGRSAEIKIMRILKKENLHVSRDKIPGAISAVGTLRRVFVRSNEEMFAKALRIIRDSYGDSGFEGLVIDGIGHLCQRYDGLLDERLAVVRLSNMHGGVKGLLNLADKLHKQTGSPKAHCIAAASVDAINHGTKGRKLPSWWKT